MTLQIHTTWGAVATREAFLSRVQREMTKDGRASVTVGDGRVDFEDIVIPRTWPLFFSRPNHGYVKAEPAFTDILLDYRIRFPTNWRVLIPLVVICCLLTGLLHRNWILGAVMGAMLYFGLVWRIQRHAEFRFERWLCSCCGPPESEATD